MAIVVYNNIDGSAVSYIPDNVTIAQAQSSGQLASAATLSSKGYAAVDKLPQLDATHSWDPATKTVLTVVPPKSIPTKLAFWQRFTATEREALESALLIANISMPQNIIAAFKHYVNCSDSVDCNDAYIQAKVQQMETAGIIVVGRAAQILV